MIKNPCMRILILALIFQILFIEIASAQFPKVDFFSRFNDNYLDEYIKDALVYNHDLKAANKRLEQFRYEINSQLAKELPSASVSGNYLGAHFPKNDVNFLIDKNSFVLPLRASYEADFLLKNRDKTRSKEKLYKAQIANQKATYISLLTDVASTYVNILLLDYLIEKQIDVIKNKKYNSISNDYKFRYGVLDIFGLNSSKEDYENQKIIYDNLVKRQNTALYNFSSLIGQSANNYKDIKRGKLEKFEYIDSIPEIISSDLIYSRPDLIEIENKLKSAKIDVTVAKKEFFPSFNITGFLAFDTAGLGNFFSWNSSFAYLLAGATQDIFKGGEKIANLKIKKARYYELVENYKQADLNAIKEINDALNLIRQDKKAEEISKYKVELEKRNFNSSEKKYKRGTISKIDFLNDKASLLQKEQLQASAKAVRLIDYFTLYKAVGGEL